MKLGAVVRADAAGHAAQDEQIRDHVDVIDRLELIALPTPIRRGSLTGASRGLRHPIVKRVHSGPCYRGTATTVEAIMRLLFAAVIGTTITAAAADEPAPTRLT